MQVNIFEAKNRLSELIKIAQSGVEIVIANRGQPVARLVPTKSPALSSFTPGSAAAILGWRQDQALPSYLQKTAVQIDQEIDKERAAWD